MSVILVRTFEKVLEVISGYFTLTLTIVWIACLSNLISQVL